MVRWLKVAWYVAKAPIVVAIAIPALGGVGAGCVEVFGLWDGESYGVSVMLYSTAVALGSVIAFIMTFMGREWWHDFGREKFDEALERYPAPAKVSSEPGDLEAVSGGDLEVV
jgi:hypothetical protein